MFAAEGSVVRCARLVSQAAAAGESVEPEVLEARASHDVQATVCAAKLAADADFAVEAAGIAELPPSETVIPPKTAAPASIKPA